MKYVDASLGISKVLYIQGSLMSKVKCLSHPQMWMSVSEMRISVTRTRFVQTLMAPTPAAVTMVTVETAEIVQVTVTLTR